MRKLWSAFFCLCMLLVSLSVFAQQGEKSVGINVGYGTASSFESFRLGAEFNWNATDHIRLSPSFDCYFASSTSYVVSADVHYLFPIKNTWQVYPLLGVILVSVLPVRFAIATILTRSTLSRRFQPISEM